ncbi:FHA domain containing protein [Tritrichomonas foetus]|uniref:E3 ubiquitin-protein ligase CHFR n=1 Tax=Tritrichomonas foetus TaxID=1144522 RepID=A0A1J4JJJ6_9EUKA|nr:FHA domain containing protein [Tritrichomonas foetus]|eukprot:OHS97691.1 FHA domain containing protein [Tritrichomonas foetus]
MSFAILLLDTTVSDPKAPPYILLQHRKTVIGRHGDVIMDTVTGKEISKFHAIITHHNQRAHSIWMLEDNLSLNGTFVNCRKIKRQILNEGDEVVFGGGSGFSYGDIIESTDKAECRYKFYYSPPIVRFTASVDPNSDIPEPDTNSVCSICYQSLISSETLPCGHSFCLTCIHEWADVCKQTMRPCICPMCRTPFTKSQLTPNEFVFHDGELQVWSMEGMLRDLGIKNCKVIKGANIFKKWTKKHETWFWKSYDIVKNSQDRLTVFLFLAEATPAYIFRATLNELVQSLTNFHLDIPAEKTKDSLRLIILKYLFSKLNPPQPRQRKVKIIV